MNNEYERLIKEGYIEDGTLVIQIDDITRMQLSEEQVKSEAMKQGARQDKGVVVIDKQGRMKKVSSLMMGYNKKNVQLADGNFANADELLEAMQAAISKLDKGTIIVAKKGKFLNPNDLLQVVSETAGKVRVGERSSKVTNQDSRYWSIKGAKSNVEHKKGIVFLGNDGIDLKQGDYVSVDELLKALNDYMIMKPAAPSIQTQEKKESNFVRVVRKYKNNLSRWLILLAALLILLSGFRVKDKTETIQIPEQYTEVIENVITQDQLGYNVDGLEHEFTYETIRDAQKRIISNYKTGDNVHLEDGAILYENSMLEGREAVIGQGIRQSGDYQISGISIVYNGKIYSFHLDLSLENPGFEIGKFINETCQKNNLDFDQVEVRLHIGNSANYTRTGWIDVTELIKENSVEKQIKTDQTIVSGTYEGVINNFNGSSIVVETVNGPVTLNVVDANGNFLAPGTIVIGSDGREYKIGNFELSTIEMIENQEVVKTVMQEQQIVTGKKLTWRIQDCSLLVGIAPLLGAIAASIATKKKNEEAQKNPNLYQFENEEEYLKFKKEFEDAKKKYEETSGFKKMLKDIFYRKEVDLLQRLTQEQVQQLYSIIINWHDNNYSYDPNDKIEFKNGKIIVTSSDGRTRDITDIIMPSIAEIGKDNKVETEGLLEKEEEQENGFHR